ncbi:MAG: type IV pilus assembly protein PilA [Halioglobus sp.]|jgi:type IV pilus assembly protein PilA
MTMLPVVSKRIAAENGFSLIEMVIVLAIIGILLVAILPSNQGRIDQTKLAESVKLMSQYQPQIVQHYQFNNEFPVDNKAAGMPDPDKISGNYLTAVFVVDGALHLQLGNKVRPELTNKFVTLRPVFVPGVENAPVSWICGYDAVPANMVAAGENRTDIEAGSLPLSCR